MMGGPFSDRIRITTFDGATERSVIDDQAFGCCGKPVLTAGHAFPSLTVSIGHRSNRVRATHGSIPCCSRAIEGSNVLNRRHAAVGQTRQFDVGTPQRKLAGRNCQGGRLSLAASFTTDGFHSYKLAIRSAFGNRIAHGTITKTCSVVHLNVTEASHRYSPAQVVAVARDVMSGVPSQISTSYVERSHLTLRQACKRFARLGNGFSKKLEPHCAAVSLHVAFYNLCRTHETLRSTPAVALGTQPITPITTTPDRRKKLRVIQGGKSD